DYEQALPYSKRALAIFEAALGPQHPTVASALVNVGMAYLGLKEPQQALEPLERALSIQEREPSQRLELASARFNLARALDGVGRDRIRAQRLAQEARETCATEKGDVARAQDILAEIDDWLAARR